jgi:hypothetical protein
MKVNRTQKIYDSTSVIDFLARGAHPTCPGKSAICNVYTFLNDLRQFIS